MLKNNSKKIFLAGAFLFFTAFSVFSFYEISLAAEEYTVKVLAPLPGIADKAGDTTTLEKYLPAMFNLAIGVSAVFAILMITIGGIQYMTTDAIQKKSEGKERIKNSIIGLLLITSAYLILQEINPNLLKFNLNIEKITVKDISGTELGWANTTADNSISTTGTVITSAQIKASDEIRQSLSSNGVYTYRSACTEGKTTGCVNLNGLSSTLQSDLIAFNKACDSSTGDCAVLITGGTETGSHSTNSLHYTGKAVDLDKASTNLNSYIKKNGKSETVSYNGKSLNRYTLTVNGQTMYFLDEDSKHWHVSIP